MTRIPVDVTAPIACSAGGAELAGRVEQLDHLRDRVRGVERTGTGLLLHFAPDLDLEALLQQLVLDEKACCRFWGFEISSGADDLTLTWSGPADAQELLDGLERSFRSDEPLTALSGLL